MQLTSLNEGGKVMMDERLESRFGGTRLACKWCAMIVETHPYEELNQIQKRSDS